MYIFSNRRLINNELEDSSHASVHHEMKFARVDDSATGYTLLPMKSGSQPTLRGFSASDSAVDVERGDTLVYIHGFNVSAEQLVQNVRDLYQQFVNERDTSISTIVGYSWPSNGRLFHYPSDRTDAVKSGQAFHDQYLAIYETVKHHVLAEGGAFSGRVHLMVHSMGGFVLQEALRNLKALVPQDGYPELWDQVIMAACDVDYACFENHENPLFILPELAQRIHVYHNKWDMGLLASSAIMSNNRRLGKRGPKGITPHAVRVVNVSSTVGISSGLGHGYHLVHPTVIADMAWVLKGVSADKIDNREFVVDKGEYRFIAGAPLA